MLDGLNLLPRRRLWGVTFGGLCSTAVADREEIIIRRGNRLLLLASHFLESIITSTCLRSGRLQWDIFDSEQVLAILSCHFSFLALCQWYESLESIVATLEKVDIIFGVCGRRGGRVGTFEHSLPREHHFVLRCR